MQISSLVFFDNVPRTLSYLDSHVAQSLLCCVILYDSKVRMISVAAL